MQENIWKINKRHDVQNDIYEMFEHISHYKTAKAKTIKKFKACVWSFDILIPAQIMFHTCMCNKKDAFLMLESAITRI